LIEKQPSCDDPVEPELLPVAIALQRMQEQVTVVAESMIVPLRESLGRVLATDVSVDLPVNDDEVSLKVLGTAWAGKPVTTELKPGEAVRIMTGGMMPEGSDTVVIQEHVQVNDDRILIDGSTRAGRNVRLAGEDINAGEVVLSWLSSVPVTNSSHLKPMQEKHLAPEKFSIATDIRCLRC